MLYSVNLQEPHSVLTVTLRVFFEEYASVLDWDYFIFHAMHNEGGAAHLVDPLEVREVVFFELRFSGYVGFE